MSDSVPVKVVTVLPWQHYMMNLHSIFCKIDANSNKLFVLLEPHSSFRFQYRLLTMTTFYEVAVYARFVPSRSIHYAIRHYWNISRTLIFSLLRLYARHEAKSFFKGLLGVQLILRSRLFVPLSSCSVPIAVLGASRLKNTKNLECEFYSQVHSNSPSLL